MQVGNSDNFSITAQSLNKQVFNNWAMTTNKNLANTANSIKSIVGQVGTFLGLFKAIQANDKEFIYVPSLMISSLKEKYLLFGSQDPAELIKRALARDKNSFLDDIYIFFHRESREHIEKIGTFVDPSFVEIMQMTIAESKAFLEKWKIQEDAPQEIKDKFNDLIERSNTLQEPALIPVPKKESQHLRKNLTPANNPAPSKVRPEIAIRESFNAFCGRLDPEIPQSDRDIFFKRLEELKMGGESPRNTVRILVRFQQWEGTFVSLQPEYAKMKQDLKNLLEPNAEQKVIQAELGMIAFALKARDNKSFPSLLAEDIKDIKDLKKFFTKCEPKNDVSPEIKARFEKLKERANKLS